MRWTVLTCLALFACAAPADDDLGPVAVPEIGDRVSADELCALHDQIRCAGAMSCCAEDPPYASEEACLAASSCSAGLTRWLDSASVKAGKVRFDEEGAADWLRAKAIATSFCGDHEAASEVDLDRVFVGDEPEGTSCEPVAGDPTATLVCAEGLVCDFAEGATVCAPKTTETLHGFTGEACSTGEDCLSGACEAEVCVGETPATMCEAPESLTPANGTVLRTNDTPSKLSVTARSDSNAGTSNDVTLIYRNNAATYSCTITATIADGGTQECTPSWSSSETDIASDKMYVKFAGTDNTDGLKFTTATVVINGTTYENGTYDEAISADIRCAGCNIWDESCHSCWIDGDGNGNCKEAKMVSTSSGSSTIWCLK
ncbi:MAG TPA: hypothetical protein PKA64_21565 [Myxococcota bacterium]|nr:hypothetical protein [Myxococcota bacterium]